MMGNNSFLLRRIRAAEAGMRAGEDLAKLHNLQDSIKYGVVIVVIFIIGLVVIYAG